MSNSDTDSVRGVIEAVFDASEDHDVETWLSHWDETARVVPPNRKALNGHTELRSFFASRPEVLATDLTELEIEVCNNLAVVYFRLRAKVRSEMWGEYEELTTQVAILHLQDRRWRISLLIFNSDLPIQSSIASI